MNWFKLIAVACLTFLFGILGFSKNLEISRKGEWASPDPFSQKFSIVLKTPDKTLSLLTKVCEKLPEHRPATFLF